MPKISKYDTTSELTDATKLVVNKSGVTMTALLSTVKAWIKTYLEALSSIAFSGSVSAQKVNISGPGNTVINSVYNRDNVVTGGAARYFTERFSDGATYSAFFNANDAGIGWSAPNSTGPDLFIEASTGKVSTSGDIEAGGSVSAGLATLSVTTSANLTAQQCKGVALDTLGTAAEITPKLATCAVGMHGMVRIQHTGNAFHLDIQDTDTGYLDGEALSGAGAKISNATPAIDDVLYYEAVPKSGGYRWKFESGQGAWTDGGA